MCTPKTSSFVYTVWKAGVSCELSLKAGKHTECEIDGLIEVVCLLKTRIGPRILDNPL